MKATSFPRFQELGRQQNAVPQGLCYICGKLSHPYGRHTKDGKHVHTCSAKCERIHDYNESILEPT